MRPVAQPVWSLLKTLQRQQRRSPFHISLYTALLSCWQEQRFKSTFKVSRSQLMALSGIRSFATYHKCLKGLISHKYIFYEPSFDKNKASQVTLLIGGDRVYRFTKCTGII